MTRLLGTRIGPVIVGLILVASVALVAGIQLASHGRAARKANESIASAKELQ